MSNFLGPPFNPVLKSIFVDLIPWLQILRDAKMSHQIQVLSHGFAHQIFGVLRCYPVTGHVLNELHIMYDVKYR